MKKMSKVLVTLAVLGISVITVCEAVCFGLAHYGASMMREDLNDSYKIAVVHNGLCDYDIVITAFKGLNLKVETFDVSYRTFLGQSE